MEHGGSHCHLHAARTYLLTPCSRVLLEQLTGFAANQEIPRILWNNPKVHYSTQKRPHMLLVQPRQVGESWVPPKKSDALSDIGEHKVQHYFSLFVFKGLRMLEIPRSVQQKHCLSLSTTVFA